MTDPINNTTVTFDDIGIESYKDYDDTRAITDPLQGTKEQLVNHGVPRDTVTNIYDNKIENIVGSPLITKRFSNVQEPPDYSQKNTRIFHQSTLIDNLSRQNLLDVDIERIEATDKLDANEKQKVIEMLKTLEQFAKLQQNTYFETKRYNKG
jgi:hypothetical protein